MGAAAGVPVTAAATTESQLPSPPQAAKALHKHTATAMARSEVESEAAVRILRRSAESDERAAEGRGSGAV